jgi:Bacteriophage CI repressor helix-turn-helix domain
MGNILGAASQPKGIVKKRTQPASAGISKQGTHADFAIRLKQLVDGAGSARAFAAQASVSEGAVGTWLSRVEPTREKLAAIATKTGVSLDWLIVGRGPKYFSDVPPGYIAIDFYDLVKSGGYLNTLGGPDRLIIFDRALLALGADEHANLLALYLPPIYVLPSGEVDTILTATDFVIVDRGAREMIPGSPSWLAEDKRFWSWPSAGDFCAIIEKGHVETLIVRWSIKPKPIIIFEVPGAKKERRFERDDQMAGITILGPVRFRAGLIRSPSEKIKDQEGHK